MSSDLDEEQMDLGESDTESDESSFLEDENEEEKTIVNSKTATDIVREKIQERYKERNGKQIFIRFPAKLPADDKDFQKQVHELSPLIIYAHKPRQKHARFCLADCKNQEDRDLAIKNIRASVKDNVAFKGIVVLIPRTEKEGFVDELVKKKLQNVESKKSKLKLKRAAKRSEINKHFTPTIVVNNLPINVSMVEMRSLFPNAVDIQLKARTGKKPIQSSMAIITLPSTLEARSVVKKQLFLGGTRLSIRFDNRRKNPLTPEDQVKGTCISEKSKSTTKFQNKTKKKTSSKNKRKCLKNIF